jgi:hypothetical protein
MKEVELMLWCGGRRREGQNVGKFICKYKRALPLVPNGCTSALESALAHLTLVQPPVNVLEQLKRIDSIMNVFRIEADVTNAFEAKAK